MAAADYQSVVQQLYVAYFGRPADPVGLANFEAQLNAIGAPTTMAGLNAAYSTNSTIKALVDQFGTSAESAALYTGSTVAFVNAIYQNVLNRDADLEGLLFWAGAIDNGSLSRGKAAMSIMAGAQANASAQGLIDAAVVANKTTVAANFTTALDTASEVIAYSGSTAAATARTMLQQVTNATDTTAFQTTVDATVASVVTVAATTGGSTFTLTTAADVVTGTSANDTIVGTLPFTAGAADATTTLTAGDQIAGGAGTDTLKITISGANVPNATAATPVLTGVEKVQVSNVATETTDAPAIDLSLADSALTSVGTTGSTTAGAVTQFNNINKLVAVEMAGLGNLNVDFGTGVTSGTSDSLTVTLNGVGSSTANGALKLTTATGSGAIETVNLTSSTSANYVTLTDTGLKTVNISGDKAITAVVGGNATLTAVDASAATGAVTVDVSGIALANFTSVKGGSGATDTVVTDQSVAAATDLAKFSGFETLKVTGASSVTLAADVTGLSKFNFSEAGDQTLTLNTGYTAATTVTLTGDATGNADKVVNSANVALTVVANVADIDSTTTITGGTGTDALTLTADSGTANLTNVTGVETITVAANATDATKTATITVGAADGTVASGKTLTVDASALTSATATLSFDGTGETNGNFNVTGGAGKDTIIGGSGNDVLTGGAGNDSITAGAGNDSISAGDGNDTIVLAGNLTSADTIDGGSGTDTLSITALSTSDALKNVTNVEVVAFTGAANVTLSSPLSTAVTFDFTDAADQSLTLATGYTGATTVKLTGDSSNSDKIVNSANVALSVQANVADIDSTTTITGGTGTDTLTLTADSGTADLTNVSKVETITIAANTTDATKTATLSVGGADGTVATGKTLTVDASALTSATASLSFTGTGETDGNFNVTGGAGNDTITGAAGNDVLVGGAGNDSLVGAAGNDSISGGDGNDTIDMAANLAFDDTIDGGAGTDTLKISGGGAYGNNGEFAKVTNVETLAVAGTTTLNVGSSMIGFNSFDLTDSADQILNLNPGFTGDTTVTLTGDSSNADKIINTANVALTVKANVSDIDGTTTITGGTGTDTLTLKADSGAASLGNVTNVESITITANSANTATIATVDATVASGKTFTVDASALTDAAASLNFQGSLETNGKFSITGGSGNDVIMTGAGADTVSAGSGDDYIDTGAGIDSITTGAGADLVKINTNSNKLTFATVTDLGSGDALTVGAGNGTATFTSTKVSLVSAATFSDYIDAAASGTGGNANSAWKWFQYGGNTYVVVDNAADTSFKAGTDAIIELTGTFDLSTATFSQAGGVGTLTNATVGTSTAAAGSTFVGTAGNDSFVGGATADSFYFDSAVLTNADTITGNAGSDTLNITGNTALTITFDGDFTGVETVNLANTTTNVSITTNDANVAGGTNMTVNGASLTTGTLTFDGGAENDANGNYVVVGGAAADTITGGAGADTITGGNGADVINGGAGADSIILTETVAAADTVKIASAANGTDTVTGFAAVAGTDVISFATAMLVNGTPVSTLNSVSLATFNANNAVGANDRFVEITTAQAAGAVDTAAEVAALLTGTQASMANGDKIVVAMNDGADTYLWYWQDTATNTGAVDAAELTLLVKLVGVTDIADGDLAVY